MPIPASQSQQLDADLKAHELRQQFLSGQIQIYQQEVTVHQTIIALGRNQKLLQLCDDLYDHPEKAGQIASDPMTYFTQNGVLFPSGTTIAVVDTDPTTTAVEASIQQGSFSYTARWDRKQGFSVRQTA